MAKGENLKGQNIGKRFVNGQSIEGNGRPQKIYSVLKAHGYNADDIKTAFSEMAWYTFDELKTIYSDINKPIIVRIVANQYFTALKGSNFSKVKEILEYTLGKPTQPLNMQSGDNTGIVIFKIPDNNRE